MEVGRPQTETNLKLFLSWSKPKSLRFAEVLREWLPEVIQQVDPWLSSEDIDKGQRWAAEVGEKLSSVDQSVLCLTAENLREPWLNFEAGALAKSLDRARVRPILLDLRSSDIVGPLAQFQTTNATEEADMRRFVGSLNAACQTPLDESRLNRAFAREWASFSSRIEEVAKQPSTNIEEPRRPTDDIVSEILEIVRAIQRTDGRNRTLDAAIARDLGQAIRTLRQERALSQRQLAEMMHTSLPSISALENGQTLPSRARVTKLDEVLETDGLLMAILNRTGEQIIRHSDD